MKKIVAGFSMVLLLIGLTAGCGGGGADAGTSPGTPEATAPTVNSTTPTNGAIDVPTNRQIVAIFSEAMTASTITAAGTFALKTTIGSHPVAGSVTYAGNSGTFTPSASLTDAVSYTAMITVAAKNLAGNALAGDFGWTFTTGAAALRPYNCGGETFASAAFSIGSIAGQDGWIVDSRSGFDEGIASLGLGACRGNGVWKLNNSVTSVAFSSQPQSPSFFQSAGESSVRTAGGGDTMIVSFFFRTVSPAADGSTFTHSFSPTTADRHTYLRFVNDLDANGGFQIFSNDGVLLDQIHSHATHLSRENWHHVKIVDLNRDGLAPGNIANDIVTVWVDGALAGIFSTWESWRAALPAPTLAVTRSLFRLSISAVSVDPSFTSPQGFYIDDYIQEVLDSSAPTAILGSYKTGFEVL